MTATIDQPVVDIVGDDVYKPKPGMVFLIFSARVRNSGSGAHHYNPLDFEIVDQDGKTYTESLFGLPQKYGPDLHSGSMAAGDMRAGAIAYEIPRSTQSVTITWDDSYALSPPVELGKYTFANLLPAPVAGTGSSGVSGQPGASSSGVLDATTQSLIQTAIQNSNDRWMASLECACDAQLASAKAGSDLQINLQRVHDLQLMGQHSKFLAHSYTIDSISTDSATSAIVTVSKVETSQVFQGSTVIRTCQGPYHVQYHLSVTGGTWKVDQAQVLVGGQTCV